MKGNASSEVISFQSVTEDGGTYSSVCVFFS